MQYTAPLAHVNVCVENDGTRVARVEARCPSWADAETQGMMIDIIVKMMDVHAATHAGDRSEYSMAIDKAVICNGAHISCVLWYDADGKRTDD